jgi:hypothetical protein
MKQKNETNYPTKSSLEMIELKLICRAVNKSWSFGFIELGSSQANHQHTNSALRRILKKGN